MRVAVVGLGGAGAHAARMLARDGHRVTGFERHARGHERGSSHGASRIIRYAYENPACTRLMRRAYPLWADFEREAGVPLLERCGGLTLGPADHERVRRTREAMRSQDVPFQELGAREAEARWPALRFQPGEVALHQEDAGFLRASRCVDAAWRLAAEAGAELRERAPVLAVRWERGEAIVATEEGEEAFDACVISAGAWMSKLVPQLAGSLTVLKQQVLHLECASGAEDFAPGRLPVWIDAGTHDYGFPADGESPGVKVAHHLDGVPVDPDVDDRGVDACREVGLISRARKRLPGLSCRVLLAQACLYTMTPTEDFVIARVPSAPGLIVASACSGHGFKFTPLTGRFAADLVEGRELPDEARAWGWPAG